MKRLLGPVFLGFPLLALCTPMPVACAQDQAVAPAAQSQDKDSQYEKAMDRLNRLTPLLDEQTKLALPGIKAVLRQVCFDADHATDDEKALAALFTKQDGLRGDPVVFVQNVQKQINTLASAPIFICRAVPPWKHGFVYIEARGVKYPIVEIPTKVGRLSPVERAGKVAERMKATASQDKFWWNQLDVGVKNKQYVVTCPNAPDGYVVTADQDFARENHMTEQQLAVYLKSKIRLSLGNVRSQPLPSTPEEIQQAAIRWRQDGDTALDAQNWKQAERCYKHAIDFAPDYTPAYLNLAWLYNRTERKSEAQAIIKKALDIKALSAIEKQKLQQMLSGK